MAFTVSLSKASERVPDGSCHIKLRFLRLISLANSKIHSFLIIAVRSAKSILLALYFQDASSYFWLAANVSFHAALGFLAIPLTNAAKDRGWDKLFSFTHGLSIYCTLVILILSIIQFFIYAG